MARFKSVCRFVLVVGVPALGLAACGGNDGDGDRGQITAAFEEVAAAVRSGKPERVCAGLGAAAREQVAGTARGVTSDCPSAVRPLLQSLRQAQRGGAPSIARMKLEQSAVVTVSVDGRTVKVPFVKSSHGWKLESFYGLAPIPSAGPQ